RHLYDPFLTLYPLLLGNKYCLGWVRTKSAATFYPFPSPPLPPPTEIRRPLRVLFNAWPIGCCLLLHVPLHLRIQTEAEKSDYQLNLRLPRPDFAKDSSPPEDQNGEPGLPQASSRVLRRWLSIFDCALFFSSTLCPKQRSV
ncbi:unnamed protein product, partial [Dibothriocephalus latus]